MGIYYRTGLPLKLQTPREGKLVFTIEHIVCINHGQAGAAWLKASGLQNPFIR